MVVLRASGVLAGVPLARAAFDAERRTGCAHTLQILTCPPHRPPPPYHCCQLDFEASDPPAAHGGKPADTSVQAKNEVLNADIAIYNKKPPTLCGHSNGTLSVRRPFIIEGTKGTRPAAGVPPPTYLPLVREPVRLLYL